MKPIFASLEPVFIVAGISDPIKARYIGKSTNGYFFEPLNANFTQKKNGSRLIRVNGFHFASDTINGKKVMVIE